MFLKSLYLICLTLLPLIGWTAPRLSISVDSFLMLPSSPPKISLSATNDVAANYDVHIGVISPGGQIFEYPDWNTQLNPWLKNITVPAGFILPVTEITDMSNFPVSIDSGVWNAAAALTEPGSLNIVAFTSTEFTIAGDLNGDGSVTVGLVSMGFADQRTAQTNNSVEFILAGGQFIDSQISTSSADDNTSSKIPAIEQCVFNRFNNADDSSNQSDDGESRLVDAGEIDLIRSDQTHRLEKLTINDNVSYVSGNIQSSFYKGGIEYTAKSTGGSDLSSFETGPLVAPEKIQLTDPSSNTVAIRSDEPLNLKWSGNGGLGVVDVSLSTTDNLGRSTVNCKFVDDGEATIPLENIQQLKDAAGVLSVGGISLPSSVFLVMGERRVHRFFNTVQNELDYGFFALYVGVSRSYSFE